MVCATLASLARSMLSWLRVSCGLDLLHGWTVALMQLQLPYGGLMSRSGWQDLWASFRPLPHACSLFARKFDSGALDAVIRQGQDCEAGFGWSPLCVNV